MADIVRGSDEDFSLIAGATDSGSAYKFVQESGCSKLICTRNRKDVEIMTGIDNFSVGVPSIDPVSTIGAGDAFNAGIIWWLVQNSVTREVLRSLGEESWLEMARTGIEFSSEVCMHFDNYISARI
jgi:fructokinase